MANLRPICPYELAAMTGDLGAVPPREVPRHLDADDFPDPETPPPSWGRIVAGAILFVAVAGFLAWCGSL